MIPPPFEYAAPATLEEAIALLAEDGEAKILAGGHSLLPTMKLRLAAPSMLVDLRAIQELRGIRQGESSVRVAAMTTHTEIAAHEGLWPTHTALAEATAQIGDVQVRNRGTLGGSLAHNDPAGDLPAALLALDGTVNAIGPNGSRTIPAGEFIIGFFETALEPGEIITGVDFPNSDRGTGSAYFKFANPASGYALVGVAARVTVGDEGDVRDVRVAVTGAADHALRLNEVEGALQGQRLTVDTIEAVAQRAGEGLYFLGDVHASEQYRAHLVKVLTRRALEAAVERARSEPAERRVIGSR